MPLPIRPRDGGSDVRRFRELLREALEVVASGKTSLGEAFRQEALAQARLKSSADDPVAQALALGRQALVALAEGDGRGAYYRLREAVERHPGLGGGLALDLLVRLGEREGLEVEPFRTLRERELLAWKEAPLGFRLLKGLKEVPASFWQSFLVEERPPSPRRQRDRRTEPPRAIPLQRREPVRPTFRLPMGYRPGEERGVVRSLLMRSWTEFRPFAPEGPGAWHSPEGALRLDEEGHLTVRVDRLGTWGGLLALVGSRGRVLMPLPWGGEPRYRLHIPLPARPGEEMEAWVWTWEALTPATLEALLADPRTLYPRELLAAWLRQALRRGQADRMAWVQVLRLLEEG